VRRSDTSPVGMSEEVMELLNPLFGAHADYLAAAFDTIDEVWGSTDRYLVEGLKISDGTRAKLRERLVGGA
jgi:protein-tyrosine phosphatase